MLIWGLTDGSSGMASQVRGVGEALVGRLSPPRRRGGRECEALEGGASHQNSPDMYPPLSDCVASPPPPAGEAKFILKQARRRWPFCLLPGTIWQGSLSLIAPGSDALTAPWPDILITSGRRSVALALAIKHASGGHTKLVHLQDPRISPKYFDLVFPMEHDQLSGDNVFASFAALHHITPEKLAAAAVECKEKLAPYPAPRMAMFLGGSTNKYKLTAPRMQQLTETIQTFAEHYPGSLWISSSRRTGADNIHTLKTTLASSPHCEIYDGAGENPYLPWLASADAITVTNDSVSMMSEALATGKPLYILNLPEHQATKPANFAAQLIKKNMARPLNFPLEAYKAKPYSECDWVVEKIMATSPSLHRDGDHC